MNDQHPLPAGVEPGADMLDIPGVGSFYLLPDPAAPDEIYAVCMYRPDRPGGTWIDIAQDELGGLLLAESWQQAAAFLAKRRGVPDA